MTALSLPVGTGLKSDQTGRRKDGMSSCATRSVVAPVTAQQSLASLPIVGQASRPPRSLPAAQGDHAVRRA